MRRLDPCKYSIDRASKGLPHFLSNSWRERTRVTMKHEIDATKVRLVPPLSQFDCCCLLRNSRLHSNSLFVSDSCLPNKREAEQVLI